MTKKIILFLSFILILTCLSILSGCSKTEVDLDLEEASKNQYDLNKEDYTELNKDPEFKEDYLTEVVEATEEKYLDESIELIDDLENIKIKKMSGQARGSCNAINSSSTCIEYYGSFWNETEMKLHCKGSGIFSFSSCPEDMAGGCNTGTGTQSDMVSWMYFYGGGEINAESIKYAKMACDATLASMWIEAR